MTWLMLSQVAQMCGAEMRGADVAIERVQRDSRQATTGDLFLALKGERFDAHDFVAEVSDKASAVMVSRWMDVDIPQILVDDVRLGLGRLGAHWRKLFQKPLIALTGSNGKTTLKEMLAAILSEQGNVMATIGNLNNDLGVPLTLLNLRDEQDFAVIEMGANHFGEIEYLTHLTCPDIAILNNAGAAHLEGFGSIEGVSRAKGEIFLGLDASGVAVINADDAYADYWRSLNADRKVISFGMDNAADVRGELHHGNELTIKTNQGETQVSMSLLGRHNAMNALAATAAAMAAGMTLDSVKHGLEQLKPVAGRLAPMRMDSGALVIDDTYNANPTSMRVALDVLSSLGKQRIYVMGDMGELGDDAMQMHRDIGLYARELKIDSLLGLGAMSQHACEAFGEKGQAFDVLSDLTQALTQLDMGQGTIILVKGSRASGMERVVSKLMEARGNS